MRVAFIADAKVAGTLELIREAMRDRLGVTAVGQRIDLDGRAGVVELVGDAPLVRLTAPIQGIARFWCWQGDDGPATQVIGYLFGDDAAAAAERERQAWTEWLGTLDVDSVERVAGASS